MARGLMVFRVHLISTSRPVLRQGALSFCSAGPAARLQYGIDKFRLLCGKFFLLDAFIPALHTLVRKTRVLSAKPSQT
jgi:hypothetical protein